MEATLKRFIVLDGEEVSCERLLRLLTPPGPETEWSGCWDFEDRNDEGITCMHAWELEKMGVLARHDHQVYSAGPNYEKFMAFLTTLAVPEVLSF